jgi:hypothetical protein
MPEINSTSSSSPHYKSPPLLGSTSSKSDFPTFTVTSEIVSVNHKSLPAISLHILHNPLNLKPMCCASPYEPASQH